MRCDPLTVCDRYSRYVVGCHACANQQFSPTLRVFKGLARYHGLPEIIRVDNGTPFASGGIGGLSRRVWWIEQGIEVGFSFLYLLRVKVGPSFGVHQRNPLSADLGQSLGKE